MVLIHLKLFPYSRNISIILGLKHLTKNISVYAVGFGPQTILLPTGKHAAVKCIYYGYLYLGSIKYGCYNFLLILNYISLPLFQFLQQFIYYRRAHSMEHAQ
jgi:hypothetical protein